MTPFGIAHTHNNECCPSEFTVTQFETLARSKRKDFVWSRPFGGFVRVDRFECDRRGGGLERVHRGVSAEWKLGTADDPRSVNHSSFGMTLFK